MCSVFNEIIYQLNRIYNELKVRFSDHNNFNTNFDLPPPTKVEKVYESVYPRPNND